MAEIDSKKINFQQARDVSSWLAASVIDFFQSERWFRLLSGLKMIAFIITFFLFWGIIVLFLKINLGSRIWQFVEEVKKVPLPVRKIKKKWASILKRLESREEASYKLAVIEADQLLDSILIKAGYKGEKMAERLEKIKPAQLSSINEIWQAHKIRNELVHSPDYELSHEGAKKVIAIYEKALEELEAI